ncbi:hypothetical protein BH09SUM1_BH09SUM1_07230 [soil metagenome]
MISTSKLALALDARTVIALADDNGGSAADSGVLEAALYAAEQEVRAQIRALGVAEDHPLLETLEDAAVTLAIVRLYERRGYALPAPWRERANRARVILHEIASGARPYPAAAPCRVSEPTEPTPLHRPSTLCNL